MPILPLSLVRRRHLAQILVVLQILTVKGTHKALMIQLRNHWNLQKALEKIPRSFGFIERPTRKSQLIASLGIS